MTRSFCRALSAKPHKSPVFVWAPAHETALTSGEVASVIILDRFLLLSLSRSPWSSLLISMPPSAFNSQSSDAMGSQITGRVECGSDRGDTVAAWQSDLYEMDETWREKPTDKRGIHTNVQRIKSPSRSREIAVSFILPVQIAEVIVLTCMKPDTLGHFTITLHASRRKWPLRGLPSLKVHFLRNFFMG